ncbi:hypothetical protein O181_108634 [Austropuccinia psidii MF-1]|uniref:Tf2-1-like SH3-like domain-containing protein n=1 Tax=Austropuccinia psidii MF-1 TaxID=1389203 RepID=A0A9Q3JV45_9BASI|nr:hypothetical protein [Austropuccinia psidii MF-1]
MTIVHKDGNIQKNADGLSRWPLPNGIDNPSYVPEEASSQIQIEGISVTHLNTTFFEEVRNSYTQDTNCSILCQLLNKDGKDNSLIHALDEEWKKSYDEGRFHLLDGYLSEDRKREKVKTCIWLPIWQKDFAEYFKTCDRCQKENKSKGKRLGNMMKIQGPSILWEIVHMDWATGLPPGGNRSYNSFLVIADRFSKTPIFSPCHNDDTAMDTALLIWNRVVSWTGIFTNIISERDPKFTSALWTNINHFLALNCAKDKWDKSHATPDFKVGDLVLVSTTNFNKIKGCKNPNDLFAGPFVIKSLHGENAFEVELSEEISNKHPTFPVSLIKRYKSSDAERFPLGTKVPQVIPPVKTSGIEKITKALKERKLRTTKVREYFVRYSYPTCEDEWLEEKDIPETTKLLRRFRHTINNNITK